jgi:hypothetical protein
MKTKSVSCLIAAATVATGFLMALSHARRAQAYPPTAIPKVTEKSFAGANNLKITVRMVAPYSAQTDLQIVCAFKHNPAGDKYIDAFQDFDDKLRGLLSALRNRGEFIGELGETILFNTWADSITPKRVLVIGLGPEKDLSLETLRVVGRVAVREAVRLRAEDVAFAPVIRDQGNSMIDVGEGDRAVAEQVLLAYDTDKRLQVEGVADSFSIREWVIEAGPAFIEGAIEKVGKGVDIAAAEIRSRTHAPYRKPAK